MKMLCTGVSVSLCVLGAVLSLTGCDKAKNSADSTTSVAPASAPAANSTGGVMQKAGLWEMTTNMAQLPMPIVTKMCVDKGLSGKLADRVDIDAICTHDKTTVHSKIHMVMEGDTAYHQTIDATYEPAIAGHDAVSTTIDGKWLGDCPSGMKAGDMAMSGGVNVNMYDAIKKAKAMKAQ